MILLPLVLAEYACVKLVPVGLFIFHTSLCFGIVVFVIKIVVFVLLSFKGVKLEKKTCLSFYEILPIKTNAVSIY